MAKVNERKVFQLMQEFGVNRKIAKQALKQSGGNNYKGASRLITGFQDVQQSPVLQNVGTSLGIKQYNSINDYKQVQNHLNAPRPAAAPAPAPAPSAPQQSSNQSSSTPTPTPVVEPQQQAYVPEPLPAPDPEFSPGGMGSSVDGGAMGFRRRKSSARMAGLTTKGASRLRINPGFSKSSGLNIGI